MKQILIPYIFSLLLISCSDTTPKGNKYYIHLHLEQKEAMGTRYLPKTEIDSTVAISDSVAYRDGAIYLGVHEEALQKMKAEGLGVYRIIKGFTVTDSAGNDIKNNVSPRFIKRMNDFIKERTEKEFQQ